MKKLISILIFVGFISPAYSADEDTFSFSSTDKQLHMLASYGLTLTFTDLYRRMQFSKWQSILYGAATTLAIGAIKEASDPKFSSNDMLANSVGITVGVGVVFTFDSIFGTKAAAAL